MQLRGPHRLSTLWHVCVCDMHVHVVCEVCVLRGQLLQCRSLEELWKNEVMSFALFHSFSGAREQRKTAALAVKLEEVDVCVCVRGVNNFSSLFDCFLVRFLDLFTLFEWFIFFVCFEKSIKKIYNCLCCALETEFTKSWANIWNINSIRYSEGDECFMCIQFILPLCFFLQYYIPDLKLSLCTEVCIRLAKDPLQTK